MAFAHLGFAILLSVLLVASPTGHSSASHIIYIVHLDHETMPTPFVSEYDWHNAILSSLHSPSESPPIHLYTFRHVALGFSAALTSSQLQKLKHLPGFLSADVDTPSPVRLHTTRTPEFLGLSRPHRHHHEEGLWAASKYGEGQIIGVVDTGIWPESQSFNDDGMPPVPRHWRGSCETGTEFNSSYCNRKLIGARSFSKALKQAGFNISTAEDYDSPRDYHGHGTHISSVAAGSDVNGADYFGYARGRAVGMAPKAHLAMYKMKFYGVNNLGSDILASLDQALSDGISILSLSIAAPEGKEFGPFNDNPIAVGTFAAMQMGVFVACAAGNLGMRGEGSIFNGAPWITTVGSGTIDRDFGGVITLSEMKGEGEHLRIYGRSIFPANILVRRVPIYYGYGNNSQETCMSDAIEPSAVEGKYVLCIGSETPFIPESAVGAIIGSSSSLFEFTTFDQPWVYVSTEEANRIKDFLIKAMNPVVTINFVVTILQKKPAPLVASESSRGPYAMSPWVFKPDILAPGVEILGATVPNKDSGEARIGSYSLLSDFIPDSGTSMSSPHVAGIAALLKNVHPDWSPAAIRSAMMTTASTRDNTNNTLNDMETGFAATPLDYGAGHIDPNRAMDPGLVYDVGPEDYVNLLCAMNYTATQIKILTHKHSPVCTRPSLDLNYPAFVVILNRSTTVHKFERRVTYVGLEKDMLFKAIVDAPNGMKILIEPRTISFGIGNRTASFKLIVELKTVNGSISQFNKQHANLVWASDNGRYFVRSPIVSTFSPYLQIN